MSRQAMSLEAISREVPWTLRLPAELPVFGRLWPAYGVFVHLGVLMGAALALALAAALGLSAGLVGAIVVAGVVVAIVVAQGTVIVIGVETFTFYHYQIVVLLAAAGLPWILGQPALPYLDLIALTLAMVQAWGRLGCLAAGCCHGRPRRWGVCYGNAHAATGFPYQFVGVRLFPVQAVESALLFTLVIGGGSLMLGGAPAGTALVFYLAGYGVGRFLLESARGDHDRPFLLSFSEAQWTSLGVTSGSTAFSLAGLLPLYDWQVAAPAGIAVGMLGVAVKRRLDKTLKHELLDARHISEVAVALRQLDGPERKTTPKPPAMVETSRGLRLSGGRLNGDGESAMHYCLSKSGRPMNATSAARVATLILRLTPAPEAELVPASPGVFHLFVPSAGSATATTATAATDMAPLSIPTGPTPTGSIPTGSIPTGSIPTGSIPTGSIPSPTA